MMNVPIKKLANVFVYPPNMNDRCGKSAPEITMPSSNAKTGDKMKKSKSKAGLTIQAEAVCRSRVCGVTGMTDVDMASALWLVR